MIETRTVDLKIEECKCDDRYHFINISADVNVNADLNINLYLGTGIKESVISDISKFLNSSAKYCSAYCRIAVTVMIEVCRNVTLA